MQKLWRDFLKFIMTGNLITLAVAFILGTKVKDVVDAFNNGIISPIIGAIVGKPEFSNTLKIGDGVLLIGGFLTAVISLVLTGFVLFAIVKAYEAYQAHKRARGEGDEPEPTQETVLLREIRDLLATQRT